MINLKKNNRKYIVVTSAVMLTLMLTMTACNDANNENSNNNAPTATPEATNSQTEALPSDSGIMDPGGLTADEDEAGQDSNKDNGETNNNGNSEEPAADVITGEGVYTGQIDPSSIEIKVNGEAQPFRYNTELSAVITDLPTDAKVSFSYTEKVIDSESNLKQLWLTKIEEIK